LQLPDLRVSSTIRQASCRLMDYRLAYQGGGRHKGQIAYTNGIKELGDSSPRSQQSRFCVVVEAMPASASCVRNPWWPVRKTFGIA
jgi:hypothetical protein